MLLPTGRRSREDLKSKAWGSLGIVALFSSISLAVTFLIAIQGDPYAESELILSKKIEDVGYSESSTRRGQLIGNYTYRVARQDAGGNSFVVSESVPSGSTSLYIEDDLDGDRLEQHQGYWYEPNVFPWRIWSHQPYRIYTSEDPR